MLHVTHKDCELGLRAILHLVDMGATTYVIVDDNAPAFDGPVTLYFETPGTYPSNQLRMYKEGDAQKRGFTLPPWVKHARMASGPVQLVALRPGTDPSRWRRFKEAVEEVYWHFNGGRPRFPNRKRRAGGRHSTTYRAYHAPMTQA